MKLSIITTAILLSPTTGLAQDSAFDDIAGTYQLAQSRDYTDVINGLEATDYAIEDVSTTLLGRTMITASNGAHRREIVVSRSTGEILSDVLTDIPVDRDEAARQAALAAASEPVPDDQPIDFHIGGSLKLGVNSGSGGYGRATVTARQNNIGGSNVDASVSYSRGFD